MRVFRWLVTLMALLSTPACAEGDGVRPGMSRADVVRILGEPDRRAVLIGKVLEDIDTRAEAEGPGDRRIVYIYEDTGVRVWFRDGKVTGVTGRSGGAD